nr:hypothetical protein [uncultured Niameybacter sp.]
MGTLFKNDLTYLKKDPMTLICLFIPVIMLIAYRVVLIRLNFLQSFLPYIKYLFVAMLVITSGMGVGFRVLDDKDENMLRFYAISPIGLKGYFFYRVIVSLGISLIGSLTLILGIDISLNSLGKIMIILQILLLTPLALGVLTIVCKNKIQGLTFMKFSSLILIVPFLRILGESTFTKWFFIVPSDTLYCLMLKEQVEIGTYSLSLIVLLAIEVWLFGSKMKKIID